MTLLTEPTRIVLAKGYSLPDDADAVAYIAAVEAADGQALEPATRMAINSFVKGCKADGIWPAIKASCILAGARTLSGALTTLKPASAGGNAGPTNNGFIGLGTDYVRKTGLVGNGSTKYLNSNRASNADPQDNMHFSCYITVPATGGSATSYMATRYTNNTTEFSELQYENSSSLFVYNRTPVSAGALSIPGSNVTGLFGSSRTQSSTFNVRSSGNNATRTTTSLTPDSSNYTIFARNQSPPSLHSNARLAFYSIGESLDLALLDTRVTTLINAFAAAIP